jgi:hypothetical protein
MSHYQRKYRERVGTGERERTRALISRVNADVPPMPENPSPPQPSKSKTPSTTEKYAAN